MSCDNSVSRGGGVLAQEALLGLFDKGIDTNRYGISKCVGKEVFDHTESNEKGRKENLPQTRMCTQRSPKGPCMID